MPSPPDPPPRRPNAPRIPPAATHCFAPPGATPYAAISIESTSARAVHGEEERPEPMSLEDIPSERPSDGSSATLFLPRLKALEGTTSRAGWSLSPELRRQITRRLRLIAITYSLAFFFADVVPAILFKELGNRFTGLIGWGPTLGSIAAGLLVAAVASSPRLSWQTKLNLGLAFEVAGSYGIALAQYLVIPDIRNEPHILHVLSPSWVAIWMLFYSIVVPAPPGKTLVALMASASAPLVVLWSSIHAAGLADLMPLPVFLVQHGLPYLICVGMAFAGTRVVYNLGADVARARELGSYRLIERLGGGGMGEVWRASHQLLLLEGLDCDDLVRRFGAIPPARIVHLLAQV